MNTKKISVCGKVGSGKSSVVSLLANGMRERGYRVLVVDSDESEPSNNILTQEEIRIADLRPQYIVETDAIGTVFIRKTFQPLEGCASGMGALGREFLKRLRLQKNEVAIVDMEAGIDHFGRSVETTIHSVLIVVEPSFNSLELVNKMNTLAAEFRMITLGLSSIRSCEKRSP